MDSFCRQFSRIVPAFAAVCLMFLAVAAPGLTNNSASGASNGPASASAPNPDENTRPLKVKVTPEYPDLARQMNMKGSVRLELTVAPDGHVKSTRVLGGNPVLVRAAEDAVRKWRYAAAAAESLVVVRFDFDPAMAVK